MKPTGRQLASALRRLLWTGGTLILVVSLSLIVCGLLALVGDPWGRAAALVLALISILGLLLVLCVVVGILALVTIRRLEAQASDAFDEPDESED